MPRGILIRAVETGTSETRGQYVLAGMVWIIVFMLLFFKSIAGNVSYIYAL